MAIIPQTQSFKLFGAGASIGATSITLQTFKNIDGTNLTMAHFGDTKGFLTIEPSSGTQEEQVSFASITNNANGTITLGTIKTVLDYTPFTETNGLAKTHGGNVEVIVSNTSGFYANIVAGSTASQIINTPAGSIAATNVQTAINELDDEVTNNALHKAGAETVTGKKTFTLATRPVLNTDTDSSVATEFVTFGQLSRSPAAGGAANSSTSVKGINQEATDGQVVASTVAGSTGARLYINPGSVGNAANKIPFVPSSGKLPTSILQTYFGGTGSDGALSGTTVIDLGGAQVVVKNYTSISLTGISTLTFTNPHANGTTIILKSQGNVTITSSATRAIDLRGLGSTGGSQIGPNSSSSTAYVFGSGASVSNNGTTASTGSYSAPSGANNSYGPFGVIYSGQTLAQNSPLIPTGLNLTPAKFLPLQPGTGGSSGNDPFNKIGYAGGRGGGAFYIECAGAYSASGTIDASGSVGTNATGSDVSGHGGGAGVIVCLYATLTSNTGTYTVAGGAAGTGGAGGSNAGAAGYSYVGLNTEFS